MRRLLRHLGAGLGLGLVTGVVARGFMALLTADPQFSWAGTGFILGVFAVAGLVLGVVHGLKQQGRRSRWWRLLALPSLVVFFGPGLLMLPGVLGLALVRSRRSWVRVLGVLAFLGYVALIVVETSGSDEPVTLRTVAGLVVMTGCCGALAVATRATLTGWSGSATPGEAEGDGRDRADRSGDGRPAEDVLDLHDGRVQEGLAVALVGQGGDGGVVLVEPDRREEREPHDHADHAGDDDQGARRAVRVLR